MAADIYDPDADQKKYEVSVRKPAPEKIYAILFTPRSGSSWLTSILTQTRAMGTPSEWFNPQLMPSSTRSKGARNLDQFVDAISRHEIHGQTFGFEITHHQLRAVFGDDQSFMARFPRADFFWLIRRDIVAQGISLDKMVQTGLGHTADIAAGDVEKGDDAYVYDSMRIRRWIRHIQAAEIGTERLIATHDLDPVRLSYEWITTVGRQKVIDAFARRLGSRTGTADEYESAHRKLATSKNNDFAARFRAENPEFLHEIESQRKTMLARSK